MLFMLRLYLVILDQTFIHYETCLVNPGLIPNTGDQDGIRTHAGIDDSQHWRKRKETIESDIFATGCCITHETNGLAPSSQVISFTFFLHNTTTACDNFSHTARQATTLSFETSRHHLADPSLQLYVANKAHKKRVSPVISGSIS